MRSWERAAPAFACLTPSDRALLHVLRDLRYLTCVQARVSCYPGLAPASVRARLGELRRRGLLARVRLAAFTDRRAFWTLAPFGRAAAGALDGADTLDATGNGGSPRSAAVAALQIDHLSATNDLFCDLCEVARGSPLPPLRWLAGWRAGVDLGQTHLVPDAVVLSAGSGDGWWTYYIERDRGTMPPRAMREKFERYVLLDKQAAAQAGDAAWQTRADAWLLLACDDTRRALRLAALAGDAGLERVWAGPAETCAAGLASSLAEAAGPRDGPPLPAWAAGALAIPNINPSVEEESP